MSESAFLSILAHKLTTLVESCEGLAGVCLIDLQSGWRLGVNDDLPFTVASSIKVPLLASLYTAHHKGILDVATPLTVDERHRVGGSGVLQFYDHPTTMSIEDLATVMINLSDNVATNMLIDLVGMDNVNRQLDELGLHEMRLRRKMIDNVAAARGDENVSTMRAAAALMQKLWAGDVVNRQVCDNVLRILSKPKRQSPVTILLPMDVEIANKPGGLDGVSCEFAIVALKRRPYVFCCAVNYSTSPAPAEFVARVSLEIYRHFCVLDSSTAHGRRLPMADLLAIQGEKPKFEGGV